jgi:murein peptide amidase A
VPPARTLPPPSKSVRFVLAVLVAATFAASAQASTTETIGRSVSGRPMIVHRVGDPDAPVHVLVVGCIHGNECAAFPIVDRLRRSAPIAGVELWIVPSVNPDGRRAGTRGNAHGVDLNRNFSVDWERIPRSSKYYSGPKPFSEPESRFARDLIRRVRPDLSIWFHQPERNVRDEDGSAQAKRYAKLVGLPFLPLTTPPGTATAWTETNVPGAVAFVVEFAAGALRPGQVAAHTRAVRLLAAAE